MLWTASATWSKTTKDPTWSRIQAIPPHLGRGNLCWWFQTHWLFGSSVVWALWNASVVQTVKVSLCMISTWISSIQFTSAIAGWVHYWVWWASRVMLLCRCMIVWLLLVLLFIVLVVLVRSLADCIMFLLPSPIRSIPKLTA